MQLWFQYSARACVCVWQVRRNQNICQIIQNASLYYKIVDEWLSDEARAKKSNEIVVFAAHNDNALRHRRARGNVINSHRLHTH